MRLLGAAAPEAVDGMAAPCKAAGADAACAVDFEAADGAAGTACAEQAAAGGTTATSARAVLRRRAMCLLSAPLPATGARSGAAAFAADWGASSGGDGCMAAGCGSGGPAPACICWPLVRAGVPPASASRPSAGDLTEGLGAAGCSAAAAVRCVSGAAALGGCCAGCGAKPAGLEGGLVECLAACKPRHAQCCAETAACRRWYRGFYLTTCAKSDLEQQS